MLIILVILLQEPAQVVQQVSILTMVLVLIAVMDIIALVVPLQESLVQPRDVRIATPPQEPAQAAILTNT